LDQQVWDTFQPIFWEGSGLCLKRKCNLQTAHSESKPRKVKHIFTK